MAIAFGTIGAKDDGTTALDIPYPSSIAAGDLLVCVRCLWTSSAVADDITDWDERADGTSGTGTSADAHTTRIRIDTKVATGSESGTLSTSQSGTISGSYGVMLRYTNATGAWDVAGSGTVAGDTSHGANRATGDSGSIAVASGDTVIAGVAVDTDADTSPTGLIITINSSQTGVGTKTRRTSGAGTNQGNDGNVEVIDAPYTGSTQTAGLAFAWTTAVSQCGPVGFVRLRETSADVTGTMATTLDDSTMAASGTETIDGTAATTLDDSTMSASGNESFDGTFATTLDDVTMAASGTEAFNGTLATTLDDSTLAATGTETITGTLATTLDDAALAATDGGGGVDGTLAAVLDDSTLAGSGGVTVTGTITITLEDATLVAVGAQSIDGTADMTLGGAALDAIATETFTGILATVLDGATLFADQSSFLTGVILSAGLSIPTAAGEVAAPTATASRLSTPTAEGGLGEAE